MTVIRISFVTFFLFLGILLFVQNCAEVAAPPGGEADRLAPTILETTPVNGSINVAPGREITFKFSEGIIRPASTKSVFISPRQRIPPKIKWKTDRLIVTLASDFDSNQTYVITLSAEITDWRRNKMDSTVSITFSTGEIIDSGSVGGFITLAGKPKGGILAGLYELLTDTTEIKYDSVYPAYITQSASDGSFKFKFLPDKIFRLVAFEDFNRNEKYNPVDEPFAVADRIIRTDSLTFLDKLYLELGRPQKRELAITSAVYTTDGLIKIRLNREIELDYLKHHLNRLSFSLKNDSSRIVTTLAFLEAHLDTSSVLTVYTGKIDTGSYKISLAVDSQLMPEIFEWLTLGELRDKNPPVLAKFSPENKPHFRDKIKISALFSEPIDQVIIANGTFLLATGDGQPSKISAHWTDPFHIEFSADSMVDGANYTMSMAEFEIFDLSGNVLGDSIQSFSFSIIDTDSLGSVSGNVAVELANKQNSVKKLMFAGITGEQSFDITVAGDTFSTELPAGKYLMSGYLDENNNGLRDLGSALPFNFAETFTKSADTITVRARFETAGIEFRFK